MTHIFTCRDLSDFLLWPPYPRFCLPSKILNELLNYILNYLQSDGCQDAKDILFYFFSASSTVSIIQIFLVLLCNNTNQPPPNIFIACVCNLKQFKQLKQLKTFSTWEFLKEPV